ncbi:hypothetical protein B0H13DRAFT_1628380 [Mycena leptocephala]|nr:hypothetical protein B0H13DRAFT_1628380 [Mycena leptocephala]
MPAEHIAFVFGAVTRAGLKTFHPDLFGPAHSTYNQLHRHLAVSTFQSVAGWYGFTSLNVSLTVAQDYHLLSEMYDNFVNGTLKTNTHSDDERPEGGDPKKNKGLFICTKEGRNPIVTAFLREQDASILKRMQRIPETRKVTDPPTAASPLSRVLPVGVPIDFWDPEFYNNELDLQERAMYINTGVAFPLPRFCTPEHVRSWVKMPAKEFMVKYGNDVLALYNIPTEEELAGLASPADDDGSDADDETTDLDDTEEDEQPMEDD